MAVIYGETLEHMNGDSIPCPALVTHWGWKSRTVEDGDLEQEEDWLCVATPPS